MISVSQPPRPAAAAVARPAAATLAITFAPTPPQAGSSEEIVVHLDRAGKPVLEAHIAATVTMVSMDMGAVHPKFKPGGDGIYRAPVTFSMGGNWKVVVTAHLPKTAKPIAKTETVAVGA